MRSPSGSLVEVTRKRTRESLAHILCETCPACGGKDRFYIQPNKCTKNCVGYYRCRQCEANGDTMQFAMDYLGMTFIQAALACDAQISANPPTKLKTELAKKKVPLSPRIESPPALWQKHAQQVVEKAHKNIWLQQDILILLCKRGITDRVIREYKIGYYSQDMWLDKSQWGLTDSGKLWIPQGIVIPCLDKDGSILRIEIRRTDWKDGDNLPKYVAISGSANGLNIIGNTQHNIMFITESELDAYAMYATVGDFAFVVAVGSNLKNPDNLISHYARHAENIFVCHDNDDAGRKMLHKWQNLYPHAKPCPTPYGKDVGEAIEQGLNVHYWLVAKISQFHGWSTEIQSLIQYALDYIAWLPTEYQSSYKSIVGQIVTTRPTNSYASILIDGLREIPTLLKGTRNEKEKARTHTAE